MIPVFRNLLTEKFSKNCWYKWNNNLQSGVLSAPLHYRILQMTQIEAFLEPQSYNSLITLPQPCREEPDSYTVTPLHRRLPVYKTTVKRLVMFFVKMLNSLRRRINSQRATCPSGVWDVFIHNGGKCISADCFDLSCF